MCNPGGITVTRAKRADFFDYLLDSRHSDLLHSHGTLARFFFFTVRLRSSPHSTGYHRIYIPITLTSHKKQSHVPHHIANHVCIRFSPFSSSISPSPIMFCMLRSLLMGHMRRCTHVVRYFVLPFPLWVDWCDPVECQNLIFVADLPLVYIL